MIEVFFCPKPKSNPVKEIINSYNTRQTNLITIFTTLDSYNSEKYGKARILNEMILLSVDATFMNGRLQGFSCNQERQSIPTKYGNMLNSTYRKQWLLYRIVLQLLAIIVVLGLYNEVLAYRLN